MPLNCVLNISQKLFNILLRNFPTYFHKVRNHRFIATIADRFDACAAVT